MGRRGQAPEQKIAKLREAGASLFKGEAGGRDAPIAWGL